MELITMGKTCKNARYSVTLLVVNTRGPLAQLAEQLTLNQPVRRSIRRRLTKSESPIPQIIFLQNQAV